jgi:para-aminobenzoate synthetase/4-amino-4-deoxychorismate lyase
LTELRPTPGVWHLVSTVAGTLRGEVGDGSLLRASFPPGSVTGAPKIQAMRVIAELESTAREAYTGAIGYASPVGGLELNVAIRTLECSGDRIWLGAGGGVVADSSPEGELEECLVKARPVVAAAGGELAEPPTRRPTAAAAAPFALSAGAERPDAARVVLSTLLVRDSQAVALAAHLSRLEASVIALYGQQLPQDVNARVHACAAEWELARLRVLVGPGRSQIATVELDSRPLDRLPTPHPVVVEPVLLPGGLGEHKWRDRRLVDDLTHRLGGVPLIADLDGELLEAGYANLWIVEGETLTTPPLDGRLLPGTLRARLMAAALEGLETREAPISLERLRAADEILLTSSVRGVHPATVRGGGEYSFETGARVRAELEAQPAEVGAR